MTRYLRRHGVDVLDYRQFRDSTIEQTLLLVRRGDSSVAAGMRTLLGTGRVVYEPDDRLLLDLTLLLGPDVLPLVRLDP